MKELSLVTRVHSNCGNDQSSAVSWQLWQGLHHKTEKTHVHLLEMVEKTHGHWLKMVYERRKRSILLMFF